MLDTPAAQVPTLSLKDQDRDPDGFAAALGGSFERFGFAIVADHGVPQPLIDRAWAETAALFALPEEEKRGYHIPGGGGARGYTPFKTEIAKDARHVDLLERIKDLSLAAERAVKLAADAQTAHNAAQNEWRGTVNDVTRTVADTARSDLATAVKAIDDKLSVLTGRADKAEGSWAGISAAVAAALAMGALLLASLNYFHLAK